MTKQDTFGICFLFVALTTIVFLCGQRRLIVGYYEFGYTRGARAVSSLPGTNPFYVQTGQNVTKPHAVNEYEATPPASRPPLEVLVGDNETDVRADVQFLLDFALIGHAKTATTFTLKWFAAHEEIQTYDHEIHALQHGYPALLVHLMYNLPEGSQYKRGYKAPQDITNPKVLQAFVDYFPQTKLIVGLRHPVLWFQSFYNFRMRQGYNLPPAEVLTKCVHGAAGVCTDQARFHLHLSYLGKTELSSTERKLLGKPDERMKTTPALPNPVFLYESTQLRDSNVTRTNLYCEDLRDYLGLSQDLEPLASGQVKTGKVNVLDICEDKYQHVRDELMKHARNASIWIREYLLLSDDVHVSSPDYFAELLKQWMIDPCTRVENV